MRTRPPDDGYAVGKCKLLHLTEKALRVEVLDGEHAGKGAEGGEPFWVAKSQLHPDSELDDTTLVNEELELRITTWLAQQKELI